MTEEPFVRVVEICGGTIRLRIPTDLRHSNVIEFRKRTRTENHLNLPIKIHT